MGRVLYATVGTNAAAITSVLAAAYEVLGYDRAVLLATNVSRRYAEDARRRLDALIEGGPNVVIDELMTHAVRDPGGVVQELQGTLKRELQNGHDVIVDVTGGTKLMSSIASTAASISVRAASSHQLLLTYTSSHGVDRLVGWWAVSDETGFYPRVPRLLAKPVIFDIVSGSRQAASPSPTRIRVPKRLESLSYRRGRGFQPLNTAVGLVHQLLNSVARDEARVYIEVGERSSGVQRIHVLTVKGLGFEPETVSVELHTLFKSEDAACTLYSASYPIAGHGGRNTCEDDGFRKWLGLLRELPVAAGLWRLVVSEHANCPEFVKKHASLVDILESSLGKGYRVWGDTNLAYLGAHNDIYELAWRMALSGRRGEPNVLRFPACAYREALSNYMEAAKRSTSDIKAVLSGIASMAAEALLEQGVEGHGTCEANMLVSARGKTILATNDKGAFNAWREADTGCAILLTPNAGKTVIQADTSDITEALRILAGAAQLIAILATILKDSNASLIIEGDERTVKIEKLTTRLPYTTQ